MLEDFGVEEDTAEDNEIKEILPLPNMEAFVLDKIIDWCTQHLDEEEPDLDKPHPDAKDGATSIMRPLTENENLLRYKAEMENNSRPILQLRRNLTHCVPC